MTTRSLFYDKNKTVQVIPFSAQSLYALSTLESGASGKPFGQFGSEVYP
jgi:hypothetical protein